MSRRIHLAAQCGGGLLIRRSVIFRSVYLCFSLSPVRNDQMSGLEHLRKARNPWCYPSATTSQVYVMRSALTIDRMNMNRVNVSRPLHGQFIMSSFKFYYHQVHIQTRYTKINSIYYYKYLELLKCLSN